MKPIAEIRSDLGKIPGVFYEHEPEETERGTDGAVQTLWNREQQTNVDDPINQADSVNADAEMEPAYEVELDEIFEIGAEIDENRLRRALAARVVNGCTECYLWVLCGFWVGPT
jgi:hypothetical protein